jgi:hypothetical protein
VFTEIIDMTDTTPILIAPAAKSKALDWLPAALILAAGFGLASELHGPSRMWAAAFALFFACKWVTWRRAAEAGCPANLGRHLGYFLGWVGMDAKRFLGPRTATAPPAREWLFAMAKVLLGVILMWGAARAALPHGLMAASIVAFVGLLFLLHFGLFHLLSCAWKNRGVEARPIMDWPILSKSLGEFWGRRWNAGFHEIAYRLVFKGLARRWGAAGAMMAGFVFSGIVHELVISWPAGAGWGKPTAYFLLQGCGILAERKFKFARAAWGPIWTIAVTLCPIGLLFHRPFMLGVMAPMCHAIGAW